MSKFHLIVTNIEANNVGLDDEQRNKEQLVQISLKGHKEKTKPSKPVGKNDSSALTHWKETLKFELGDEELQETDYIKIKIFRPGKLFFPNRLLGKAELCLDELLICKERKRSFKINLCDGNNQLMESILQCDLEYACPVERRSETTLTSDDADGIVTPPGEIEAEGGKREQVRTLRIHEVHHHQQRFMPDKPLDFQIRVKVIEARQLEGGDINPVIRVSIGDEKKQTRVQKTTNRPYYNQTFSFNFTSITYRELFEEQIKFEAFDSQRFRSDALIGFYKCDVRAVYDLKDHILLRKWIMLTEPEQSGKIIKGVNIRGKSRLASGVGGSPAGFVKISMVILEADVMNTDISTPTLEDLGRDTTADDIESNLLQLPGVYLTPAIFTLKVYKAEDLPQMDPKTILRKAKDWVDPYCVFSFAGKMAKTAIRYDSKNPNFYQQLSVPFQFPSVCDKMKIQLMDWDRLTAHDHIGATYLSLPSISGDGGTGFLPTFGPCFINVYGSPREFSALPTEHDELNKGIGEGVAYRGRLLVELETKLNVKGDFETGTISEKDIVNVQPYMRRQKFRLLATFLEATMLAVEDSPVEFEMSIGNYGNKLDETISPSPCSTPPTNPVFDGHKYYYIPWGNSKPYVRINCQWEDITFRLGALNVLLKICARLERNIEMIKSVPKVEGQEDQYKYAVFHTLDHLINDCSFLPEFDPHQHRITRLDLQLRETRDSLLTSISEECEELKAKFDNIDTLPTIEGFLKRIRKVAVEPQNSIPDIIIWMLKGGTERVAYCRIPAYELLYKPEEEQRGVHCGKVIDINLKYPGKKHKSHESTFPALLRMMLWFGLEDHQVEWDELKKTGGDLSIYAETYENQTCWLGIWSSKNFRRPAFSNASGTLSLPPKNFVAPDGWEFVSDTWDVHPELNFQYSKDSGCKVFLDDVFENEQRLVPGGSWRSNDALAWTDIYGEALLDDNDKPITNIKDVLPPKGWQWSNRDGWKVDFNRAVDHDGWEYTVETSFGTTDYEAAEKTFHFCRRRRWIRERTNVQDSMAVVTLQVPDTNKKKEGWEYAISFGARFHTKRRGFDLVRRQRLHRKLRRIDAKAPEPVFLIGKDEEEKNVLIPPSIFLYFERPLICQLRAYLYQGRNLLPSDPDGLADPYVQLSFGTRSSTSKTIHKKLNPTWDQMLVLENVPIYGHHDQIIGNPPDVLLELFDRDPVGKHDFLGRVQAEPVVFLPNEKSASDTKLTWYKVRKGSGAAGDVLAAFELFMDEDISVPALPPPDDNGWYPIPPEIRPATQRTAIEVLCWGLRNLGRFRWMSIKSPSIEVEIGGHIQKTSIIKNMKDNPNFSGPRILHFTVDLPCDDIYIPPITIRLRSNSSYGRPIIGVSVVDNLHKFRRREGDHLPAGNGTAGRPEISESVVPMEEEPQQSPVTRERTVERFDWWSKYDASRDDIGEDEEEKKDRKLYPVNYDRIKIYPHTLEKEFGYFQDFIMTFPLHRGKIESFEEYDNEDVVGEFKGNLSIYDLPEDSSDPPRVFTEEKLRYVKPIKCLVRVYIVRAYGLAARDSNGMSDPYLVVSLGNETFDDKDNYVAETDNVQFGKVFEFHASIPTVKDLNIKVMDYDQFSRSDLIGETDIDLESRLLSRRHAIAGLPTTYNISGPNQWRLGKSYPPSVILSNFCKQHGMEPPRFLNGNTLLVLKSGRNEQFYDLKDFEDKKAEGPHRGPKLERLALHALRSFEEQHKMVPEHVETRELMNSLHPGFSQGKVEMFVDILPEIIGHPSPPLDISPRQPTKYELRVIVWNTKDVQLDDTTIYGDKMSDIYVKCKMNGVDHSQKTDVHYRSLDGDGMFNWRMVFEFEYSENEEKVIVMKKTHLLSRRKFKEKLRPELLVQVWDNDIISRNDFIGSVKLDLQNLAKPFGNSREIKNHKVKKETFSLFDQGSVRGWWPVEGNKKSDSKKWWSRKEKTVSYEPTMTGKVELTLELLESDEAEARKVGKGREKPNQHPFLEDPQRPATSFFWLTNPWKSFRYIIWHHFKWYFIIFLIIALIVLFVALFIYAAPGYSVKKIFKA